MIPPWIALGAHAVVVLLWLCSGWRPLTGLSATTPWMVLAALSFVPALVLARLGRRDERLSWALSAMGWLWGVGVAALVWAEGPWTLGHEPMWLGPSEIRYSLHPALPFTPVALSAVSAGVLLTTARRGVLPGRLLFWLVGLGVLVYTLTATPPTYLG